MYMMIFQCRNLELLMRSNFWWNDWDFQKTVAWIILKKSRNLYGKTPQHLAKIDGYFLKAEFCNPDFLDDGV